MQYLTLEEAIEKSHDTDKLIFNESFKKYFLLNSHQELLDLTKKRKKPTFCEYLSADYPKKLFFDIEIHNNPEHEHNNNYFNNPLLVLDLIETKLQSTFTNWNFYRICLSSNSNDKKSYHLVYVIRNELGKNIMFTSDELKNLYKKLEFDIVKGTKKDGKHYYIIDPSVYKNGLFRSIYSSKERESTPRPIVLEPELTNYTDNDVELQSFVCYTENRDFVLIEDETIVDNSSKKITKQLKKINCSEEFSKDELKVIYNYISENYGKSINNIQTVFINKEINSIVIALKDVYCHFIKDNHLSNHQYIIIDKISSKQKCHDELCNHHKYCEISCLKYPKPLVDVVHKYLINDDLIDKAKEECKEFIRTNFDREVDTVNFDRETNTFTAPTTLGNVINFNGKCPKCNVEHQINIDGYCMVCTQCSSVFPENTLIPVGGNYNTLNNFWNQFNIVINNNTIINGEESFNCDIDLDQTILNDKILTKLFNQALDGHKIVKLSETLYKINSNYKYCNEKWYTFNGNIWEEDVESIRLKLDIVKLEEYLNKIYRYYENNSMYKKLLDNIKSLHNKLHKPGFENEIITGAKLFYFDKNFFKLLNSKKHLVPFNNGVYDLILNKFRKADKDDYINLSLGFDYNESFILPEVTEFLNKILPNPSIKDWVLKKLSECLNGDIPNTHFLMFIGDGANGKSQLLNLMKLAMGELGEKVEVTLLTRKRNNANETNTEKLKLLNKRFAFLSEPEDGEKINIGLLKELTGSEEIVARGLYQDSISFVMETKLFLACNELPEIKGEDTALWRRIRVVDFPSRFVDEPKEYNEYKIDRSLPSRMREDVRWRQSFINILLSYYYKDVSEPKEVKMRTNEYRNENSEFETWLSENIEHKKDSILKLTDVIESFKGAKVHTKESNKYKKQIEQWIKTHYPTETWEYQQSTFVKVQYRGWLNFCIKS